MTAFLRDIWELRLPLGCGLAVGVAVTLAVLLIWFRGWIFNGM